MRPDRIKISMEFQVLGNGIWLTSECGVAPDEDPIEEFKKGRDMLIQSFNAMNTTLPVSQVKVDPLADEENNRLLEETRVKISKAKTKEMAELILNESGFRLNIELKNLVNSKQYKTSINGKDKQ